MSLEKQLRAYQAEINALRAQVTPDLRNKITKAEFQRRFQPQERYALNALRKQIAELSAEQYVDPANTLLLAAEDVMFAFEQPLEYIELDHPETYQGLMLLSYLGILTEARVTEIIKIGRAHV